MRKVFLVSLLSALFIFISFALYSYRSSIGLIKDVRMRTHAFNVHERVHLLSDSLDDAETSRFRYIISGNKNYLKRFNETLVEIDDAMRYLHGLDDMSDEFLKRLNRLERLIDKRTENLKKSVESYMRHGNVAGTQIALTAEGVVISKSIDEIIGSILREQRGLFSDLEKKVVSIFDHIILTMIIGTLITFTIILLVFCRLNREMLERRKTEKELAKISRRNELILDSAAEGIFGLDEYGNHTFLNRAACAMLGYRMEELIGKHSHSIWHHTRADGRPYPQEECMIYRTFREGLASHVTDEVFWRKDGTSFPVEYRTSPVYENEKIRGVVVTFSDITWRRKAEQKMALLIDDLKRSNTELEQFAYVASHDLKEPLLVIATDLKLLERKYREGIDPEAKEFISDAIERSTRMQALISDLLLFSRIGHGKAFELIDCAEALKLSLANLKITLEKSGAVVTYDKLPSITADPIQVAQLLQNLISNAIKFNNGQAPRVHISAGPAGDFLKLATGLGPDIEKHLNELRDGWVFEVNDNGSGIPPEHYERIFDVFHRVHKDRPGSGIGLATCRKIVERHGGRIWVKSEPGKGSSFYFTIPSGPV